LNTVACLKPIAGNSKVIENFTGYKAKILFLVNLHVFSEVPGEEIIFYKTVNNAETEQLEI